IALAALDALQQAGSLDRLGMLALRDPLRRVAHTVLLLLDRLSGAPATAPAARLEVGQELIAAFASLSRQTTNRQLRRLVRAGVARLVRRLVDVRDIAELRSVAAERRPLRQSPQLSSGRHISLEAPEGTLTGYVTHDTLAGQVMHLTTLRRT